MAPRRKPAAKLPTLAERTPLAEWCAAGLGLVLTVFVVGYSLWEGLSVDKGPPDLRAEVTQIQGVGGTHVAEIEVRNLSPATAADVEVTAVLKRGGQTVESHGLTLDYVPGLGAARGGVVFREDPAGGQVQVSADAYVEP